MANKIKKPSDHSATLGLAAVGSAGGWEVSLDESSADKWFAEVEAPSIYLSFEILSPDVMQRMLECLTAADNVGDGNSEILLGKTKKQSVTLVRDDEFRDRFFLIAETHDSLTVRLTISGKELKSLVAALEQVNEDIAENR